MSHPAILLHKSSKTLSASLNYLHGRWPLSKRRGTAHLKTRDLRLSPTTVILTPSNNVGGVTDELFDDS